MRPTQVPRRLRRQASADSRLRPCLRLFAHHSFGERFMIFYLRQCYIHSIKLPLDPTALPNPDLFLGLAAIAALQLSVSELDLQCNQLSVVRTCSHLLPIPQRSLGHWQEGSPIQDYCIGFFRVCPFWPYWSLSPRLSSDTSLPRHVAHAEP